MRKAALDKQQGKEKAKKLVTAMEVRKQKDEAAYRKASLDAQYHDHLRKSYAEKMHAADEEQY